MAGAAPVAHFSREGCRMRGRIAVVVLGGLAAAVLGAAGAAVAEEASLKRLMGEN
jgi:hypothetical protein